MMIRLSDARRSKGAQVIYYPPHLSEEARVGRGEMGVITDANDRYVMVLYLGDRIAKATHPDNLVYAHPSMQESYERVAGL